MTINYTEKGIGLHKAIGAAGHSLECVDGVWVSSNDAAVQAIIDSFDPLVGQRAAKWDDIVAERERRKTAGVRVGANVFHSDADSRIQQLGLVIMGAGIPAGLQWKTLTPAGEPKVYVTMTATLAGQIFTATAASDQAIFAAAESHRVAMESSADPASYDFSAGWPEA